MAITDISISEELMTDAPSIKYRGNEGPKSPKEMEMMMTSVDDSFYRPEYADDHAMEMFGKPYKELNADELEEFMEEMIRLRNKFSGPVLPSDEDPINPFQPKPIGPVLPDKMAFDDTPRFELKDIDELINEFEMDNGRRPTSIDDLRRYFYIKYGDEGIAKIEEIISDRQTAAYGGIMGADGRKQYGIGSYFQKLKDKFVDDIIPNEIKENPLLTAALVAGGDQYFTGGEGRKKLLEGLGGIKDFVFGGETTRKIPGPDGDIITEKKPGALRRILDIDVGDDKTLGSTVSSMIAKNIVPIVGGIGAGLFTKNQPAQAGLPSDDTALQLADLKKSANLLNQQQGLAADMNFLPAVAARKFTPEEMAITYAQAANGGRIGFSEGGEDLSNDPNYQGWKKIYEVNKDAASMNENHKKYENYYMSQQNMKAEGGIMDLGGMEKDYRNTGGFVDIGAKEKADDVPARLSVNEFVFTADAVRNAGGGDIDEGAKIMENMMKHLEQGGQISEESQGMAGARDMFATSERLSEVL